MASTIGEARAPFIATSLWVHGSRPSPQILLVPYSVNVSLFQSTIRKPLFSLRYNIPITVYYSVHHSESTIQTTVTIQSMIQMLQVPYSHYGHQFSPRLGIHDSVSGLRFSPRFVCSQFLIHSTIFYSVDDANASSSLFSPYLCGLSFLNPQISPRVTIRTIIQILPFTYSVNHSLFLSTIRNTGFSPRFKYGFFLKQSLVFYSVRNLFCPGWRFSPRL